MLVALLSICMWASGWNLYFLPFHLSVLHHDRTALFTVAELKVWISSIVCPPTFFFKIILTILGPLYFCIYFKISSSVSTKRFLLRHFIEIVLNL